MEDPRVAKCLAAKRESKSIEFKEKFSPSNAGEALELLKDIIAIANSGGGTIAIGIDNRGVPNGADVTPILEYDHAKYCDLIHKYTLVHFADFEVVESHRDGKRIAIFVIGAPDFPIVFQKPGQYAIEGNKQQKTAFGQGTLFFRHGAKSEHGTTDDLRKFMQLRMREMEKQLLKGLRKVTEAPRGAQLQVVQPQLSGAAQAGVVKVHLTTDPSTQAAIAIDRSKICPHRQKEVLGVLSKRLPNGNAPSSYDLQMLNNLYKISKKPDFCWVPRFSSKQFSDAYIDWIVQSIQEDPAFIQKSHDKFRDQKKQA